MTECCLFVCCRIQTSIRLVNSIYPPNTTGYEEKLSPMKLKRLIDYILAYPKKLRQICSQLESNIHHDLIANRCGYVMITLETFRQICKECSYQTDIIETIDIYLFRCFKRIFSQQNIQYLEMAYPTFLDYTDCNLITSSFASLIDFIFELCSPNASNQLILIGLRYLYRILGILSPTSGEIEKHLGRLIPRLFHLYATGLQRNSNDNDGALQVGVAPETEMFVDDDGTLTIKGISESCLELLLLNPAPKTSSHALRLLFRVWDRQHWEPFDIIANCLVRFYALLDSSSHYHPSLSLLLISHAYFLLTDTNITTSNPNTLSLSLEDPLPISMTTSFQREFSITTLGSEYMIRTFPQRMSVICKILTLVSDIYFSQAHSRISPKYTFTKLSPDRMMEHLSHDESIFQTFRLMLEFLSVQWRNNSLLLRNFSHLTELYLEITPSPSTDSPHYLTYVEKFLTEYISLLTQKLPINKLKKERIHPTTPSNIDLNESCYQLFLHILRCIQAMIPTITTAKNTIKILLYINDSILNCDSSTSSTSSGTCTWSPNTSNPSVLSPKSVSLLNYTKSQQVYRLLLLFCFNTILKEFIINLRREMKSCGVVNFSLDHTSSITQQQFNSPPSTYLTSLYSNWNMISSSSVSSSTTSASLSLYILLSNQQLCQYITLYTNPIGEHGPIETWILQMLILIALEDTIYIERIITILLTLFDQEKIQRIPLSLLPLLNTSASISGTSPSMSYLVISQRNQILRDFIFHQLCSQTYNGPDPLDTSILVDPYTTTTTTQPQTPLTGRISLCKVQMLWNLHVSLLSSLPLEPVSSLSLILYLEEFCQLYPIQQFIDESTTPLHTNIPLASSIHLISSILYYINIYFLYLSSLHHSFKLIQETLLNDYQEYLSHCNLFLQQCHDPLNSLNYFYTHLLQINTTRLPSSSSTTTTSSSSSSSSYQLELYENPCLASSKIASPSPPSTKYSESILLSPFKGIDRIKLHEILVSSPDSPFTQYKQEVDEAFQPQDMPLSDPYERLFRMNISDTPTESTPTGSIDGGNGASADLTRLGKSKSEKIPSSKEAKSLNLRTLTRYSTTHLGQLLGNSSATSIHRQSRNNAHRFHSLEGHILLQPSDSWKQKCVEGRIHYHEQKISPFSSQEAGEEEKKYDLIRSPQYSQGSNPSIIDNEQTGRSPPSPALPPPPVISVRYHSILDDVDNLQLVDIYRPH